METLQFLADGFAVAFRPENLFYCLIGCIWGTVVGVLPRLGPLAGLTLLLPLTFKLDPATAIIMLSGIFYGAMYGGSVTSILVRIPGEAASIMTCIDGHEMAKKGRAGPALVIAAVGSWIGGTFSIVGLMLFAPPLAELMLKVSPAAEFALMLMSLLILSFVSSSPPLKTLAMVLVGLAIGCIGLDPMTAFPRYTYGSLSLTEGVSFVAIALGLFGVSEILINLESLVKISVITPTLKSLIPRWADLRQSSGAITRGTIIGFIFGFIPGISHIVSTFVSYAVEKKLSKNPETFGTGRIEGVAGPETANNATTGSALVPLLVLGIPALPATAILLSALLVHGVQPGPQLINEHPEVFWGLIASMYVGNCILLILNVPMVGLFVNLLRIPYHYLAPLILVISVIGMYSVNASASEILIMAIFGPIGLVLRKAKFDPAPLLLAIVIGARMEVSLRRALFISEGNWWDLLQSGASKLVLGAILLILILQGAAWLFGVRRKQIQEADQ